MKSYTLLRSRTDYSLKRSPTNSEDMIARAQELGLNGMALTDAGGISGAITFYKKFAKAKFKGIHGELLNICEGAATDKSPENKQTSQVGVLAKNLKGWKQLIKLTSAANISDHYFDKPRLDLLTLNQYTSSGDLIGFSGAPGTTLGDSIWDDRKAAYSCKNIGDVGEFLHGDFLDRILVLAEQHRDVFGAENFFLELNRINERVSPATKVLNEILQDVSNNLGIKRVASADAFYPTADNSRDQQIMMCAAFKGSLENIRFKLEESDEPNLIQFFDGNFRHYIPSLQEMQEVHSGDEIENTNLILSMVEDYDVTGPPMMPKFSCPNGMNEDTYLKELCRKGWKDRFGVGFKNQVYVDRINMELQVFSRWQLSGYFLIVQDYIAYMKNRGRLLGDGRGSSSGCLISYLLKITEVNPIPYGLSFERFFNEGRCQPGRAKIPDIDTDFPRAYRYEVYDYLKDKYGKDKYGKIMTFGTLKGKAALKEVLRVNNVCDAQTMNQITQSIQDEAKISDELQTMKELGVEPSIIMWSLENKAKELHQYCYLDDNGSLQGEFSKQFEQAIRLEGCRRDISRHPSAVVISNETISNLVPMIYDETSDDPMIGMTMGCVEDVGLIKLDILSLGTLDKLMICSENLYD